MPVNSIVATTLLDAAEASASALWTGIAEIERQNSRKVLAAMRDQRVGQEHFAGSTGYGHDDLGRDCLDRVFAQVMGAQAALVRGTFASGTHAIAVALFGALSPGQELLYVTGSPYDTLDETIGLRGTGQGSLADWGVRYRQLDLSTTGQINLTALFGALTDQSTVVAIQRSRGYSWRPSIPIAEIGRVSGALHRERPEIIVFVDNCYGEFVEGQEPPDVGADLIAGSLIKNPGGGIVPCGGYVAGRRDLVSRAACRLTAPGIGAAGGATLDSLRLMFQGLFMAPHAVAEALKGATTAAAMFSALGYEVDPLAGSNRTDIIQGIKMADPQKLTTLCRLIQQHSPVSSYVQPIPATIPGYGDQVVMAGGTFVEGSTLELSCDGPLREPYVAYLQGGLSYAHCRLALEACAASLLGS